MALIATVCFTVLWGLWYFFIGSVGCAFNSSQACVPPWPWDLSGSNFHVLVTVPGGIFLVLLGLTIWLWRKV